MRHLARAVCLLLVLAGSAVAQPHYLSVDEFVTDWQISKQFTIAVAAKMPADAYDFKATPEQMSFAAMTMHIAGSLLQRFHEISGDPAPLPVPPKAITKDVAIDWLNRSFDYVIALVPTLTDAQMTQARFKVGFDGRPGPDVNGRDMIMNMFVHVAHHRAQLEVYLRLKGIAPPVYTF